MIRRWQEKNLIKGLKNRRIVFLTGARQCGKTTLVRGLPEKEADYVTLDNPLYLKAAQTDPMGFIKRKKKTLIIDEVQKAPDLLPAIKLMVDQDNAPGQYLLTGSANILSLSTVHESLAGRVKNIRLRPLAQGEINGCSPQYLDHFFEERFEDGDPTIDKDALLKLAFRGGFPEALRLDREERKGWFTDYLKSLIEKDLRDISTIYRMDKMKQLIEVAASWSGKMMDYSAVGTKLALQRATLEGYLQALETLYIIEKVNPWVNTDYERVGKKSKLYMSDCGIMVRCLKASFSETRLNPDPSGKIIETFVLNELLACIGTTNDTYQLFQYRDREKREIDFLIEREDGALLGIEVKAGTSLNMKAFKHLEWFKDNLSQGRGFVGIVLYSGDKVIKFADSLWAVPISNLWHKFKS